MRQDILLLSGINTHILRDRPLDEINFKNVNISILQNSDLLYNDYMTNVLSIDAFKMNVKQYRNALTGLPMN